MLLTLNARRTTKLTGGRASARIVALAAALLAGTVAALLIRPGARPAISPADQPMWAGAIGSGVSDPIVSPLRETSASYTSPVAIQAASSRQSVKACVAEGTCPAAQRVARTTILPPRRPAPEPSAVEVAPTNDAPKPKPKSAFSTAALIERLPSPKLLLKPFTSVGDRMSNLIKSF